MMIKSRIISWKSAETIICYGSCFNILDNHLAKKFRTKRTGEEESESEEELEGQYEVKNEAQEEDVKVELRIVFIFWSFLGAHGYNIFKKSNFAFF